MSSENSDAEQYSQGGQDVYVTRILKKKRDGYFVEVGAVNGIFISNTYLLEKKYGWKGLCIEANPYRIDELTTNRPNAVCIETAVFSQSNLELDFTLVPLDILNAITEYADTCVDFITENGTIIKVNTKTLNDIFIANNSPNVIDYLSIDTNGTEDKVLEGIDFTKYTFNVITVETSSIIEKQKKIDDILTSNGYILHQSIVMSDELCDNLYIHNSILL